MKRVYTYVRDLIVGSPRKQFLWAIFLGALVIRVGIAIVGAEFAHPEMYEHGQIAHNLYHGHGFSMHWPYASFDSGRAEIMRHPPTHEGAFLPPANPYLLVLFYHMFGENEQAHSLYVLLLCLLSAVIPLIHYLITALFTNESCARLASLLSCFNVIAAFAVTTYSGSVIYQLLAPLSMYLFILVLQNNTLRSYLFAGVLTGLLVTIRSEYLMLGPILMIGVVLMNGKILKKTVHLKHIVLMAGVYIILITPWIMRNYEVFDTFVPTLSHPWYEVWRGNNPRANGATLDASGNSIWVDTVYHRSIVRRLDSLPYDRHFEIAADSIFKTEVINFWRTDVGHAFQLGLKKLAMFATSDFSRSFVANVGYSSISFLLFITAIIGIISQPRRRSKFSKAVALLFGCFLAYYLVLTFFTVMLPRYQIYVLNTLLPMSAAGLFSIGKSLPQRRTR
jgi:hypothetical protein